MNKEIYDYLELMVPNPVCELDYEKDYELLIATLLSAHSTDKRVNMVTKELFKYSLEEMRDMDKDFLASIIRSAGSHNKKSSYVKFLAGKLIEDYNGVVPNNRDYLESLPGVGRKTVNVVLSNIYDVPTIAVDTHVRRVSNILGIVNDEDDVTKIEKVLMSEIPIEKWNRVNDQLLLFGRYICKAKNPDCKICEFNNNCKNKKD